MCCRLCSYNERVVGVDAISKSLLGEMTETEAFMLDTHDVIEIRGKVRLFCPFQPCMYLVLFQILPSAKRTYLDGHKSRPFDFS